MSVGKNKWNEMHGNNIENEKHCMHGTRHAQECMDKCYKLDV